MASPLLFWGFVILSILVVGIVVIGIHHTSGPAVGRKALVLTLSWLTLTGVLGWTELLDTWAPPPMGVLLMAGLVFLAWAARQPWTMRLGELPLRLLVGFQAFRILVELLLHEAVAKGIANPTMTWTGTNFDMIPGVTALLLVPFVDRINPRVLQGWNLTMAGVLVVTVVTGILAAPSPFRQIMGDPPNVFIAGFPGVWLPTILVLVAWLGHIVLFRRLNRG
jgi:hypothetical protein